MKKTTTCSSGDLKKVAIEDLTLEELHEAREHFIAALRMARNGSFDPIWWNAPPTPGGRSQRDVFFENVKKNLRATERLIARRTLN